MPKESISTLGTAVIAEVQMANEELVPMKVELNLEFCGFTRFRRAWRRSSIKKGEFQLRQV